MARARPHQSGLPAAAFWLGFALGGFFDGVLLHQILQWHHLLSATGADLPVQILADGLLHAAMYGVALVGLWLLWRARAALQAPGAGRVLAGFALLGFAAWHAVDAVLSHWLLGLHRIRMDVPQPLLWDIGWLLAFGALPAIAGVLLLRRRGAGPAAPGLAAALLLAILGSGLWSAQPGPSAAPLILVVAPFASPADVLESRLAQGGGLAAMDPALGLYFIQPPPGAPAWGAFAAPLPPGCFDWSRPGR